MASGSINNCYGDWNVSKLKVELAKRGATTSGRKEDLVKRLEYYIRNQDFKSDPIIIPEQIVPNWPTSGFQQLTSLHRILLPKLSTTQIEGYFKYRVSSDRQCNTDIKALQKGQLMLESNRVDACSVHITMGDVYLSGIVRASMKKKISYSYKLRLHGRNAEVQNSQCECPAGKGPNATCKHIAAVLLLIQKFVESGVLDVEKSCTEGLQTFHKPRKSHTGSPVKADLIPSKKSCCSDDPRPEHLRHLPGYGDFVRNAVINYCAQTSMDMTMRYLYPKASLQTAVLDHDYLQQPFTEYWVDQSHKVSTSEIERIEVSTRKQSRSKDWYEQRRWRITASRFGDVCLATERRNRQKLCSSILSSGNLNTPAIIHGQQYESAAVKKLEKKCNLKVKKAGLFISHEFPFLAATPDGVINEHTIVEVKCPYSGRHSKIAPGKSFPFLEINDNEEMSLKPGHRYYFQIQGQLNISGRSNCIFVVYTFEDMFIQHISVDQELWRFSMIPKLQTFYEVHYRKHVASAM